MPRKNLGKLLLIILILLSGCSVVEKSKEQKSVSESKLQETDEVSNTKNATNTIESLATSTEKESNSLKGNWIPAEIFLTIDFGEEKKTAQVEFKDGMTVFDALKNGTENMKILLETQMYNMGVFINKIGDKKNGQENNYWTYYVNDEFANVAADKYKLKAEDRVEWKFSRL